MLTKSGTVWADVRGAASADSVAATGTTVTIGAAKSGSTFYDYRNIFNFDTSAIPTGVTLTSTFNFYVSAINGNGDWPFVVAVNPAADNNIATGDFDAFTFSSGSAMTVNSTGAYSGALTFFSINAGGITRLGMVSSATYNNSEPGGYTYTLTVRTTDYTGTSSDPYLSITWPNVSGMMPWFFR
jgi:hypothetical protein